MVDRGVLTDAPPTELTFDSDGGASTITVEKGSSVRCEVRPASLDEAIDVLRTLNCLELSDAGGRISDVVEVHGAHPWWFLQDYAYWIYLVPLTQFRHILDRLPVDRDVVVRDPPRSARALLRLWGRAHGRRVHIAATRSRLRHGLEELSSILSKLVITASALIYARVRRPRYLLYTIDVVSPGRDHDFRISSIYRELRRRGETFVEYAHSTGPHGMIARLKSRRRPVVYWEELVRVLGMFMPRRGVSDARQRVAGADPLIRHLAAELLTRADDRAFATNALRRVIQWHRPRLALVLDDSRHANEIVAACRSLGVPVVGYQHGGMAFQYHPGLIGYGTPRTRGHAFDRYAVWSSHYHAELISVSTLYDARNTFVSGPIRLPDEDSVPREPSRHVPVRVLVIEEVWAIRAQREIERYLEAMLRDDRIVVTVRIRPGWQPTRGSVWDRHLGRVRFHEHGDIFDALATADVCFASYSSALSESVLAFTPAVIPYTSFTYADHLVRADLADVIRDPSDTVAVVRRAAATPIAVRRARRERLWGEPVQDGAKNIVDAAEMLDRA